MANLKILRGYVFISRKILEFELFVSFHDPKIFWAIVFFFCMAHGFTVSKTDLRFDPHGIPKAYRKAMVLTIVTWLFL